MSINQTQLYDTLQSLTQQADVQVEFIYGFLNAYGFAKNTITQIRNGGVRNVAKIAGDVALKGQLYFRSIPSSGSVHETAESLKDSDAIKALKSRFVIVTNFDELVAYDLKADERIEMPFTELHQQYAFFLPLAGLEKTYTHTESVADVKAAEKMGRLFDLICERNQTTAAEDIHAFNVFLTRLLFCFFAEDTGIFAKHQFSDAIKSTTAEDGNDVSEFLGKLFAVLNEPDSSSLRQSMPAHLKAFPYVNGGLFGQKTTIPVFGPRSRRLLLECSTLDWSQINPDIFGSMFQAVIEEEQRGSLGQHYTSVSNIMKVIKPLFLDKLYDELERSLGNEKRLQSLLERLTRIRVFDPACGSGNFLIIAYKELRRFEMEVFRALNDIGNQHVMFMTGMKLSQFYGIEIDDFAHEIALLSLWLAEHQMHTEFEVAFGHSEPMLPLKSSGNIIHGNSLHVDWRKICPLQDADGSEIETYVCGNPPYLGYNSRTEEQKNDMEVVFKGFKKFKDLDFVSCWFWIGAQYISGTRAEVAFVSTNSICQGEQVSLLWPKILSVGVSIHIAYQTFSWSNNARLKAGVHVTVIGLSTAPDKKVMFRKIDGEWHGQTTKNIMPYLLEGNDIVAVSRTSPISKVQKMVRGSQPSDGGNLLLNRSERDDLLASAPESAQWLKRIYGAEEFIQGKDRWCLWLADVDLEEVLKCKKIARRLNDVTSSRLESSNSQTRELAKKPHLFWQDNQPRSGTYIIVPLVSSERREYVPMGFMDASAVANNLVSIIPEGTVYEFGVLTSTMHNDWMRTVGGRLKSDYRYSASMVYNTFPWPETTELQRSKIETLAEEVLMVRENYPDKSLAYLYDPETMPGDLKNAHRMLDAAVERLYRSRPFRDASDRLEHLFARYEILIEQERQQAVEAVSKKTRKPRATKTAAAE